MAETNSLLNCRTEKSVPGVRIPLSPPQVFGMASQVQLQVLNANFSGCSVARLSRLLWEQEVAGSNPATPTKANLVFHVGL